ncbi:PKD domain containing protein [Candidatus Nanopelagicaceae bacterium]
MRKLLICLVLSTFLALPHATAADCVKSACIDVYTKDGQIIIEGKKGSGPTAKAIPKPRIVKPKVVKPIFPELIPRPTATPKPKRTYKPRVKSTVKPTLKPKATTSVSLNDRLIKLLPTGGIAYQPELEPLVNVPIYFWSDLPTQFATRVKIVGEVVDVLLRPGFVWSFGDGTFLSTTDAGGPYPYGKIKHTYKNPGIYPVTLVQTWNGNWTHNGTTRAITGTIKTTVFAVVTVVIAPTRFMF